MATDNKETAKSVTSLAELIKKQKAAMRDAEIGSDIDELGAYIENATEKIRKNTIRNKISEKMEKRWNNATNPRTYFRAVLPKMFKTWHENMDLKDQMQDAERKRQELMEQAREKAISTLKSDLKKLIDNDSELTTILKDYGEKAAMEAAMKREEHKALKDAEEHFFKNMSSIEDRLKNLDVDAQQEWAKRKGIQLVKIVDHDATTEELSKIKSEISEQIEKDAERYDEERKANVKEIKRQQREKEELLQEKSWWKKYFNKPQAKKPEESGSFLDALISGGLSGLIGSVIPLLLKAGLLVGIGAAFEKYINDPEFRSKVNEIVGKILGTIWEFMKEHWQGVLAALAIAFPVTTIRLIGKAVGLLYDSLVWLLEEIIKKRKGFNTPSGRGRWGRLAATAAVTDGLMTSSTNLTSDILKEDNIKALENEDFYKKLTPEEVKTHKELVDKEKFTEAEAYRTQLAQKHGYRPTSISERMLSGSLTPQMYTKSPEKDIQAITSKVSQVDVPGAVPVEIANFGDESIKQIADIILVARASSPVKPVIIPTAGNKEDPSKKSVVTPKTTPSARDSDGIARQSGGYSREYLKDITVQLTEDQFARGRL